MSTLEWVLIAALGFVSWQAWTKHNTVQNLNTRLAHYEYMEKLAEMEAGEQGQRPSSRVVYWR